MITNWYVIQVPTKKERLVCERIKDILSKDIYTECFVPLAERVYKKEGKVKIVTRPLFPGYLFIISDYIEDVYLQIKKVPYFTRVLHADFQFVPLEWDEVAVFADFLNQEKVMEMSKGYIEGSQVYVTDGPLKGQEGRIKKVNRHKRIAIIETQFMGKMTSVHVPLEIVSKI